MNDYPQHDSSRRSKIVDAVSAVLKTAGYILTVASVLFLANALYENSQTLTDNWFDKYANIWFVLAVACNVAAVTCGFLIWQYLLRIDRFPLPTTSSAYIYFVSQIGKYLPGNVAQHIGRVILARKVQLPVITTTRLIIIEQVIVVLAGSVFVCIISIFHDDVRSRMFGALEAGLGVFSAIVATSFAVVLLLLVVYFSAANTKDIGNRLNFFRRLHLGQLAVLAGYGFSAFVVLGLSLQFLLQGCLQVANPGLLTCIVWITSSWLISFFTPGAPAGIGIREFILISMISGDYGQATAVEAALAFRGVSIVADLAVLAIGLVAGHVSRHCSKPHAASSNSHTGSDP